MASKVYDALIIGSGPSGGRIARDLTAGGMKCALVEAGKRFTAKQFPLAELDASAKLFWGGGVELSQDASLAFLRARVLGGTSIVNQALLDPFDEMAWSDWKDRSGVSYFSMDQMQRHYDAVASTLSIQTIEDKQFNQNTRLFVDSFDKKGLGWSPLHRAQKDCKLDKGSDCIACLGGCPRNSKQSTLVSSIFEAEQKGLEVMTEFEVHDLKYSKGQIMVRGVQAGLPREVVAKQVVLAAGSFGSSQILLRSGFKSKLKNLGTGISSHPQFMTYARFDQPIDAHKGAFQGVKSYDPKFRKQGVKLENVFAPPIATAMLFDGIGKSHLSRMKSYRHLASMEVAIRDDALGELSVDKTGKLKIKKTLTGEDWKKVKGGLSLVRELFESVGGKDIVSGKQVFGLHLMGGCAIGVSGATSVVNPEFQVHDHPGLWIADSSVFPSAPGINPSYTIMAMSHRATEHILKGSKS